MHVVGERARAAVRVPVVPRRRVHQRLREQRRRVEVVRELRHDVAHRGRVGGVERRTVGLRIGDVALRQRRRCSACSFADAFAGALPRLPDRVEGLLRRLRRDRRVDVRPERERHAPVAHRAVGIDRRGLLERANRLGVVERVGQRQALVEVALRLGRRGRDLVVQVAEVVVERRLRRSRFLALSEHAGAQQQDDGDNRLFST